MPAKIGKLTLQEFDRHIAGKLGAPNPRVLVPPQLGVDAGVIDVGNGNVLVVAEDPIFPAPGLGLETFGWFTVHIGASDVAVMGVKPQCMTYSLLMPPATPEADVQTIVTSIHQAALELEIAIVGGHTLRREGYYMRSETKEWLQLAQEEFQAAEHLFGASLYRMVCYHAQQAVEKSLKAILIEREMAFARTHNILDLCNAVRHIGYESPLSMEDAAFLNERCL